MTGKNRVAWREGMFLRPQHFQAQERYFDAHIRARVDSVQPYAWGFTSITVDEDLASLGKFGVLRASGVLPDGTPFSIPDELPPPPPLDVPADARDAIVSLTLPAAQPGAVEFREAEAASHEARFAVAEQEVSDAFSDDTVTEPIEFGLPNLRFGVTRDQTYGRVALGLARVREVNNKKLVFDDRYIPPTLDIAAAARLTGGLTDIVGRVEQRAEELALRAVEATDGGSETFASFLLLQALNRWLPMLRHLERRACLDVAARAPRNVVDDDRELHGVGDGVEVRHDPALRRLVVHRRGVQEVRRASGLHLLRERNRLRRVVGSRAGHDGHAPPRLLHGDLDDATLLGDRHGGRLPRGSAGNEEVDPLVDLPVHEGTQRALVECPAGGERCGEGGAAARDPGIVHRCPEVRESDVAITSCIVNMPCRPTSHRAAASAPSAKTRRSRAS